jgi:prophage maintenance system killer protein
MDKRKLKKQRDQLVIYQTKSGKIEFRGDFDHDTVWGTQQQIAEVFSIDRTVVTRHINKIFKDKEIDEKSNVQKMHIAKSDKPVKLYSLDVILAVGYRTNSSKAIAFRIWTTKTLKQHLLQGYTINKKSISRNYNKFMRAVEDVKALLPAGDTVSAKDVLELINIFASTWFSLNAYDEGKFPKKGASKKQVYFTGEELVLALQDLKRELIVRSQATGLFGQETNKDAVSGIVGNVFQSFAQQDVYPSIEEKAANLLYFIVKNHPFIDGNKRCGAFSFVWFLKRAGELSAGFTPEALTALTLLVAESSPKDKEKLIGVILLLLKKD